jgi:hypothetical protein
MEYGYGTTMENQHGSKRVTIADTTMKTASNNSGGQGDCMLNDYMRKEIQDPKQARKWLQAVEVPSNAQ